MVTIPTKYQPQYVDVEAAVVEMLQPVASECDPPGRVVTALPADAPMSGDAWWLLVTRTGGGVDEDQRITDRAVVAVSALSSRRSTSWELAGMVRAVMGEYEHGGRTEHFTIADTAEQIGPVQSPFASPDRRIVTTNYRVSTQKLRRR